MGTHRFRWDAVDDVLLQLQIEPTLVAGLPAIRPEIDITLVDDTLLDDLKVAMDEQGFSFLASSPTGPVMSTVSVDTISLASPSRLVDIDTTSVQNGTILKVLSVEAQFQLDKTSVLAADGITIVAPLVGPGRWLRVQGGSIRWANQASWTIDPAAGNDENDGSALAPLLSLDEWGRRVSGQRIGAAMVVTLLAGSAGAIRPIGTFFASSVQFVGDVTSTAPAALTAVTVQVPATNTRALIATAATPFTDKTQVRIVGGPRDGALSRVTRIPAANQANVSSRFQLTVITASPVPTLVDPVVGDMVVTDTLNSAIQEIDLSQCFFRGAAVIFTKCRITTPTGSTRVANRLDFAQSLNNLIRFWACEFAGATTDRHLSGYGPRFTTCWFSEPTLIIESDFVWYGCVATNRVTIQDAGHLRFLSDPCFDVAGGLTPLTVGQQGMAEMAGVTTDGNVSWVDGTGAVAVDVINGGQFVASQSGGRAWGADNAWSVAAWRVRSGSTYVFATLPSIPGAPAGSDLVIGGTAVTYSGGAVNIPYFNAARMCGAVDRA